MREHDHAAQVLGRLENVRSAEQAQGAAQAFRTWIASGLFATPSASLPCTALLDTERIADMDGACLGRFPHPGLMLAQYSDDVGFAKATEITEADHSPIQTDRAYEGSVHDAMPG
jgi:hypothetical protein